MNYKIKNKLRRPQIPSEALKILSMVQVFQGSNGVVPLYGEPTSNLNPVKNHDLINIPFFVNRLNLGETLTFHVETRYVI